MAVIKAIETAYGGCRFRSRLEARWAVFFDAQGWAWEYEPQGFTLPSGNYLPDFRVSPYGGPAVWFEVKAPGVPDDARWPELAASTETLIIVAKGMHRTGDDCMTAHSAAAYDAGGSAAVALWMNAPRSAWDAASGARFEHGESGAQGGRPSRRRGRRNRWTPPQRNTAVVDPFENYDAGTDVPDSGWSITADGTYTGQGPNGPHGPCGHGTWGRDSSCDCVWCDLCQEWARDNGGVWSGKPYLSCTHYIDGSGSCMDET